MKKIIRLTENDLSRIIRRVIQEQTSPSQYKINQVYEGIRVITDDNLRVMKDRNVPQHDLLVKSNNQKYTLTIVEVDGRDVWANINGPGVYEGEKFPHKLVLSISMPDEPIALCGNMELGCFTQLKRIK